MAVALTCALLAFACNHEDDSGLLPAGESPMTFSTSVEQQLARSSSSNSWDGGEEVAIHTGGMVKKYIAATDGKLSVASGVEPFYWQDQSEIKIVQGWYPYSATVPTSWVVKTDQNTGNSYQESDLLFTPPTGIAFSGRESTPLKFYHQTAKVVINIVNAEAATNAGDIAGVKIGDANNLALSSSYTSPTGNATQGTWSNLSAYANLTPKTLSPTGTYLKSYAALVIPQDMTGKKFIAVALTNGNTYYYTPIGTDAVLQGGKAHTYNITVNRTGITVSVGDITDWTGTGTTDPTIEGGAGAWKVGDYYPDPNAVYAGGTLQSGTAAIGVVYWIDPSDSRHGKVLGLKETIGRWGVYLKDESVDVTGIRSTTDGKTATRNLIAARKGETNFTTDYFIFNWIYQTMNSGIVDGVWYLPAMDELSVLYSAYNTYGKSDFNDRLNAVGGDGLGDYYYWSSSENDSTSAWGVFFGGGNTYFGNKGFSGNSTRCILAF